MEEIGTVKAWIDQRGMGFITGEDGATDHFVHRSSLKDGHSLQIGASVTFVAGWDAQKDKPIATEVTGAIPQPTGVAMPGQLSLAAAASPTGSRQTGTVKAWMDERGMGFIAPDDGGEDLFVHRSMLADGQSLAVGSPVYFVRAWDAQKNKGIAQNVQGAAGGASAAQALQDNLFISDLPPDMTEESLWTIFGQYGQIASLKLLPENGSPHRVAMVRMASAELAAWLVSNLDGNIPVGLASVIGVKFAQGKTGGGGPRAPGPPVLSWSPAPQASWSQQTTPSVSDNLFIGGLPLETTNESVTALLLQYGAVISVKVLEPNGKPDRAGMVRMGSVEEAAWMVENLNGNIPQGLETPITVKFANSNSGPGKGYGPAPMKGGHGKGSSPYGKNAASPSYVTLPTIAKKDKLVIAGFPGDATNESVMAIIEPYAEVIHVTMTGVGTALLHVRHEAEAQWMIDNLNGNIPQGLDTPVTIKFGGGGGGLSRQGAPGATGGSMTGTVKHWVEERGMGFISTDEGDQDVFVHRSDLLDGLSLVAGTRVNFTQDWDNQKNKPVARQVSGATGGGGVGKGAMKPGF